MRRINKIFLTGCGYTVLILTLFYAFAALSKFTSQSIAPGQFALILCFGFIISLAEFMYEQLKIRKILKCLIHYFVLLIAFCVIFIIAGKISTQRPAIIFIAVVLYTIIYFVIYGISRLIKITINCADVKLDRKLISKKNREEETTGTYKPRYSDGD